MDDWNGIKVHGDSSDIVNERDDVLVVVYGDDHHREARRLFALNDEVERLRAENAEYIEALEWYADRGNYDENHAPIVKGWGIDTFDEGNRARDALLDE